ncbi:MAG: DNA-binding HxlR family transcriptional regulator [Methanobacteriota archaeon]|jgi:DNA-binding HxlR family transcriptional regulator|uniref:Helix-turn-helix domain-containing protein n=1 Tax=Halorutilus salinus TaxID=2487751 RepID=A0A9Q4C2T9_9EURY|nr:helix-turn-helix domain-containing protein [Halorutilus salinus]MCX2818278.1 helix-turn-helix domain-containing protein [Halorutilus salinus]
MKPRTGSGAEAVEEKNSEACPVVEAVEEIGSRWRLIILHDLQEGEKRFNQLEKSTGASSSTLSRVLDDLEELGLVRRRVEESPIASYYRLTPKGEALSPALEELADWSEEWLEEEV